MRCTLCEARSFKQFLYRGRFMCIECVYEYAAIYDGHQSKRSAKKEERAISVNELFEEEED